MGVIGRRTRMHRAKAALALATCLPLAAAAQPTTDAPALDWEQARQRLEQVSDALAAADAAVRNKQDLQDATRLLRLPEITGEVRRLQFQKTSPCHWVRWHRWPRPLASTRRCRSPNATGVPARW
jgi:hypothetical protein